MNHLITSNPLFSIASSVGIVILQLGSFVPLNAGFALASAPKSGITVGSLHNQQNTQELADSSVGGSVALPKRSRTTNTQGGATRSATNSDMKYTMPVGLPKRNRVSITGGAATRGGNPSDPFIELLAPSDHTGITTEERPEFFMYVSAVPTVPIEFSLRDEQTNKTLVQKRLFVLTPGVVKIELPADTPALELNKEYLWSVSLITNAKDPKENTTYQAWVQRTALTPEQSEVLSTAKSSHQRAVFYAQAGVWYNAIGLVAADYLTNPQDETRQDNVIALLAQVDIDQSIELDPNLLTTNNSTAAPSPTPAPSPMQIRGSTRPSSQSQ